jgi:uncharacterized membrane protein
MSGSGYAFLLSIHIVGLVLWISGLTAIYWMLRFHDHAPKEVHEQLTLQERALALSADIMATVTIGTGIAMGLSPVNLFTAGLGWLHLKVAVVLVAILPVHGILRAKIKRFGMGQLTPVAPWTWSLLLAGFVSTVFIVTMRAY